MQTTIRKDNKTKSKDKTKDETPNAKKDEKKKVLASTPRNFVQKASTTDIYGQKKKNTIQATPKKIQGLTSTTNISPTKNLLKSSPSSVSQTSRITTKDEKNTKKLDSRLTPSSARKYATPRLAKDLPVANVTVNSPVLKKKTDSTSKIDRQASIVNSAAKKKLDSIHKAESRLIKHDMEKSDSNAAAGKIERQRTKTRTLKEDEVKVLTPEVVDNNAEMINLTHKLAAKPKAFYIDLEEGKSKVQNEKVSDGEVSYEDDFESYESDFESYQSSEKSSNEDDDKTSENSEHGDENTHSESDNNKNDRSTSEEKPNQSNSEDNKDMKDEERMLDSGNFELRESQRSANRSKPAVMDFILEDGEQNVKVSLTDEGFQEMSSSSAVSSMKTIHVDVLDRPLFIDFTKSKENKRKRRIFERLKQRAEDILSMVTLHEMSYSLFEMKPIPYEVFMATFGRSNYLQVAVQTFDDGVSEEIQTDEIDCDVKWTQHPVKFSKNDIYLKQNDKSQKYGENNEDYLSKFTFLLHKKTDVHINNEINLDENYTVNPLRIYFEQKHGVGGCEMLSYESYKSKLKNNEFNVNKLRKFLKKVEGRISNILSTNTGTQNLPDIIKSSKFAFSKGYTILTTKNVEDEKLAFVKNIKITNVVFSDSKDNVILTVHKKSESLIERCVICLWDLSVVRREPFKILTAIDNILIGRFRGNTDGVFVAALEDGSIHLWDLFEEPTWRNDTYDEKSTNLVEIKDSNILTQTEKDRLWNLQNRNVGHVASAMQTPLQACAYTNSALNMQANGIIDKVVGLELAWNSLGSQDGGRKVLGQVCSLQLIGIITIWSIIQEKLKAAVSDMGKAFWSKLKLEKCQTISLIDHIGVPKLESSTNENLSTDFNLNAAKRRMMLRKKEKTIVKNVSRPKSAVRSDIDTGRPRSAANSKRVLPPEINWENGIVCSDLKLIKYNKTSCYLVAKNRGEVLSCTRVGGTVKINRFKVSNHATTITSLEVSPHHLPLFLAATNTGTVNLCSLVETRVLLTLDCHNHTQVQDMEKYNSDHKGRYVGSVTKSYDSTGARLNSELCVSKVLWSGWNPCWMFATLRDGTLMAWDLTYSDINAKCVIEKTVACAAKDNMLALMTSDGEVHIHRLGSEQHSHQHIDLFKKYLALL